jgi:hypothetical protein
MTAPKWGGPWIGVVTGSAANLDFNVLNNDSWKVEAYHVAGYPSPTGLTKISAAPPANRYNWIDGREVTGHYYYENGNVVYRTDGDPTAPTEETMGTVPGAGDAESASVSPAASYWFHFVDPTWQVYKVLHSGGGVSALGDALTLTHNPNGIGDVARVVNGKVFIGGSQLPGAGLCDFLVLSLGEGGSGAWTEEKRIVGSNPGGVYNSPSCQDLYGNATHVYASGIVETTDVAASIVHGVFRSAGAGSWSQIYAPTPVSGVDMIRTIWARGDQIVVKLFKVSGAIPESVRYSPDGGATWSTVGSMHKFFYVGEVAADQHVFVDYDPDLDAYQGYWLEGGTFTPISVT